MSDDSNKLNDDFNELMGDAKETAKEFAKEARKSTKAFSDDARRSADDFTRSANETFGAKENKKLLSGILGILLGWLGIHKFVLGYNTEGIILLILGLLGFVTCGITSGISWLIGLIEGIIYLTKTDDEFYATYQVSRKPWF